MEHINIHLTDPQVKQNLLLSAKIKQLARSFFEEMQFLEIDTPVLMPETGESYNATFQVTIDGVPAMLADSPQVYKMLLSLAGYERYYQLAHCFRSIKGETRMHTRLSEFMQIDVELADTSLTEMIDLTQQLLSSICKVVAAEPSFTIMEGFDCKKKYGDEMLPAISESPLSVIFIQHMPLTLDGIAPCHHIFAKPSRPITSTDKAALLSTATESFDIIINGIEVGGGDLRIHDAEEQEKMMQLFGVDSGCYANYLKLLPENPYINRGGFAIGLERLIMAITETTDIHNTTAFPDYYTKAGF